MPTPRPRHIITKSDALSKALKQADQLWPEAKGDRGLLIKKVLESGIEATNSRAKQLTLARIAEIRSVAGSLSNAWPQNWRDEPNQDWPA